MKKFLWLSKYVFIFCMIMFIVETFYPMAKVIEHYLGWFGLMIGHLIALWGLIGLVVILFELFHKYAISEIN